jgi:3-hydroxyisobutyrate dehydrogenase-like beta-hydroxyacid dehydrogenase
MSDNGQDRTAGRWLIVGHGSVGSALARRLSQRGARPWIYDPAPRVPVVDGELLRSLDGVAPFDQVISCVVPSAALKAIEAARPAFGPATLYLEWNTLTPEAKQQVAAMAPGAVVDVALLDTLDQEAAHPSLAVSGPRAADAAMLLRSYDFLVAEVGAVCGDAALLKLSRSLFMKCLEALVLEFNAAVAPLKGRSVVIESIERNLGHRFTAFSRMLIETDRIHAERRATELEEAVTVFAASGRSLAVAEASVDVLRAAAVAWRLAAAPKPGTGAEVLAAFLSTELGGEGRHAPR